MRLESPRKAVRKLLAERRLAGHDHANVAGNCMDPVELFLAAARTIQHGPTVTYAWARCRKCPACLYANSMKWGARGAAEIAASTRTWFGTLTLAPEHRMRGIARASRLGRKATVESEDRAEETGIIGSVFQPDITKMMKRLRKLAPLRYLCVMEAHIDGIPHWHMLIHERGERLSKRDLDANWRLGFTQFRLVDTSDPRPAFYVSKYLSKAAQSRVRASMHYGRPPRPVAVIETNTPARRRREAIEGKISPLSVSENVPSTAQMQKAVNEPASLIKNVETVEHGSEV